MYELYGEARATHARLINKMTTLNQRTKIDAVTSWNDPDEIGERVVRYRDVRCPSCDRMFWCIRWEAYGWPEVHCDACGFRESWPFEEGGLKERYEEGPH